MELGNVKLTEIHYLRKNSIALLEFYVSRIALLMGFCYLTLMELCFWNSIKLMKLCYTNGLSLPLAAIFVFSHL